jgi:integrase
VKRSACGGTTSTWLPGFFGFVFTTPIGTPIDPRGDYLEFRKLLGKAGVSSVRLHDLRHTAASLLLAQGVPPGW